MCTFLNGFAVVPCVTERHIPYQAKVESNSVFQFSFINCQHAVRLSFIIANEGFVKWLSEWAPLVIILLLHYQNFELIHANSNINRNH